MQALRRAPLQLGAGEPERVEDRRLQVLREGHLRALGEQLRRAGRSPSSSRCGARPGGRSASSPSNGRPEAWASRWRTVEPVRPGRLVEVEDALLRGDQRGVGGEQLRDRGPAEDGVGGPRARRRSLGPRRRRRPPSRPARNRSAPAPPRSAILVGSWSARSSPPGLRTSPSSATRARCAWATGSSSPARRRSWRTAPTLPADAYGQASRCLEVVGQALTDAGASLEDVVRTRVYLTDASAFDGFAKAHGEAFSEIRPANTTVVVAALLDPRWLLEIEAEAVVTAAE